jgi:AraC family transcriptional regulator
MIQVISKDTSPAASPLLAIAAGPTRIVRSSTVVAWKGLILEEHSSSPGIRPPASINWHVVSMTIRAPSIFEHRGAHGPASRCSHRPGMIMVTPSGPMPDLRSITPADFVHCALDANLTRQVFDEHEPKSEFRPTFQVGIRDKSIQALLSMLSEELVAEAPLGKLYVDSLAQALASRLRLLNDTIPITVSSRVSALPAHVLKRVREKIEANIDGDLSLDCLAEESRYSRAHFLRMFRAATGLTPYQYVTSTRLKLAQERLLQRGSSIIDVAMSCGFASQSHMTNLFRQHFDMTPAEFRRNGCNCAIKGETVSKTRNLF